MQNLWLPGVVSNPLGTNHAHREIGSGTGLVGLCIASAQSGFAPMEVVISDQEDHLGLIRRNARANGLRLDGDGGALADSSAANPSPIPLPGPQLRIQEFDWVSGAGVAGMGARPFDVVLGTDVAYCTQLYEPVVKVRTRSCRVSKACGIG